MAIYDQFPGANLEKTDISDAVVTLDNNEIEYDGTAKTKTVTSVVLNGVTLTEGTNYVVSGNIEQNVGEYVLRVIGIGNYTGVATAEWEIIIPYLPILSENTPAQIKQAAQEGVASSLWSVGDRTAAISISAFTPISSTSACAFILGFDHNSSIEGTGITFQFGKTTTGIDITFVDSSFDSKQTSGTWFNMNNSGTNSGGWSSSRMRSTLIPAFISALPSDWQAVLADTTKYTDNVGGGSTSSSSITATTDKVFLLSEYEVYGTRTIANQYEQNYQAQYKYYQNDNSKTKYKHSATSTVATWWLRSPNANASTHFCFVQGDGAESYATATYCLGFAPAFRIA